jgi:hypothetical protein
MVCLGASMGHPTRWADVQQRQGSRCQRESQPMRQLDTNRETASRAIEDAERAPKRDGTAVPGDELGEPGTGGDTCSPPQWLRASLWRHEGTMLRLQFVLFQADEAAKMLRAGAVPRLRTALLLLDNCTEVLLDRWIEDRLAHEDCSGRSRAALSKQASPRITRISPTCSCRHSLRPPTPPGSPDTSTRSSRSRPSAAHSRRLSRPCCLTFIDTETRATTEGV